MTKSCLQFMAKSSYSKPFLAGSHASLIINKLRLISVKLRIFWLRYEIVVVLQTGSQIFSHLQTI